MLNTEDRVAWSKRKPSACPGITVGNFEDSKSGPKQYAVLLHSQDGPANSLVLLAKTLATNQIEIDRITLWQSSYSLTVSRLPPGKYRDYYQREQNRHIEVKNDVLVVGLPTGRATAFYFEKKQLRTFSLTD